LELEIQSSGIPDCQKGKEMLKQYTDLEVRVREFGRKVASREEGASAVEYGLLVALIAVVIIIAVALLGTRVSAKFNSVATSIGA